MNNEKNIIGQYKIKPAVIYPYDSAYPEVAELIKKLIVSELKTVCLEHIGSTSVPDCDGKGIIDLLVLYDDGRLSETVNGLYKLGFQDQPHKEPFSQDRPMLVGTINYKKVWYQVHLHIIGKDSKEATSHIYFRDLLRKDKKLMRDYVSFKQNILKDGVTDSLDYCKLKSKFIERVLKENLT